MSRWIRSSSCSDSACIEVKSVADGQRIWLRWSGRDDFGQGFSRSEWDAFIAGIKAGEFDNLEETP